MKRVLIIEDESSIAELQRDYLESHGFEADIEQRGDTGLARALQHPYDLVILDLMLPFADGFEICRRLRKEKDVPILMISAKKEDIDKIRGLGLGADDYMTKPFSPGEMVARVQAHLSRYDRLTGKAAPAEGERLRIRGLLIDKSARQVFVNGDEAALTNKEYELLLLLASHPGRVFGKEELFERVWGLDSIGDIATLTVHVRRLREKIEEVPSEPKFIETVWGIGYRLRA
ncbi:MULTISPECIES: response regulator transcription factor [unclassified Paenibacillus]|uniref:response regulator transcription factor n=1 Tax=unclassified Paenibacillus TaxID=185978 RepID=UPI00095603CF|nr:MULTISPECIES: response regulator transcription factor [unclassified Paenibacillus]ASS65631.1 response regulator transcription factor [Paenibacillus sp. RUD330]SIQ29112.1 DNA-binding response regulator, OmpR family, contains REC and winged-helix (wHTH) domain [Paenibacillus sp. RU4X]SIQ51225.1 DNA-binding response regulator, OmpR family, contains REC and winged-helix (wHTH) domain [Paenibacillus sp. RU4T]